VFDFFRGQDQDTSLYLVQEYVDGTSLKQRMEGGPILGEQEVYELALGLLDVLEYLHGRAPPILHRDIKPSNVLLRAGRAPALVDFGAVCVGWRPPDASGTTVVGTIGYMPPEQLLGQAGPASDLYALGATLLHVLTGVAPHEFPFESGRIEVPSDLPARHSLRQVIEAVLRPAPRDRPQTAANVRRILLDEPSSATTPARVSHDEVRSRGVRRTRRVVSGDGPQFVDMGLPPRDPEGEFADVYHNLVNPVFPTTRLHTPAIRTLISVGYGLWSVVSLGIVPLIYFSKVRNRKRRYTDLFCRGEFTEGWIVSVRGGDILARFLFDFEVAGVTYRGSTEYASAMRRYWSEGDAVAVLCDPEDPSRCCFVHR
jgi:serine/threonine protein kinase